jgi:hypothetical protein
MNRQAQPTRRKGFEPNMTNEETTTAASVAERGAHGASKKAASKKGTTPKKGAAKSQKTAKGGKKAAKPTPPKRSYFASRREQGGENPGPDPAAQRRNARRTRQADRLAESLDPWISLRYRRQEDGTDRGIHQARRRRARLLDQQVASPPNRSALGIGCGGLSLLVIHLLLNHL